MAWRRHGQELAEKEPPGQWPGEETWTGPGNHSGLLGEPDLDGNLAAE